MAELIAQARARETGIRLRMYSDGYVFANFGGEWERYERLPDAKIGRLLGQTSMKTLYGMLEEFDRIIDEVNYKRRA